MKNYYFSKCAAKTHSVRILFAILLVLIETQLQATRYRQKLKNTLTTQGICDNVYVLLKQYAGFPHVYTDYNLADLFFQGLAYPVTPYNLSNNTDVPKFAEKHHRWGDTPTGDRRMLMLAKMIKDLTDYLTNDAVL